MSRHVTINKDNKYNKILINSKEQSIASLKFEQASPDLSKSSPVGKQDSLPNNYQTMKVDLFLSDEDLKAVFNLDYGTDQHKKFLMRFKNKLDVKFPQSRTYEIMYGVKRQHPMWERCKDVWKSYWNNRKDYEYLGFNKAYLPFKKGHIVPNTFGVLCSRIDTNTVDLCVFINGDRLNITFDLDNQNLSASQLKNKMIASHWETTKGSTDESQWDPNSPDYYWR